MYSDIKGRKESCTVYKMLHQPRDESSYKFSVKSLVFTLVEVLKTSKRIIKRKGIKQNRAALFKSKGTAEKRLLCPRVL